jgi:hypothetical protein
MPSHPKSTRPKFVQNPLANLIEREIERLSPEPKETGYYASVNSTHSSYSRRRFLQEDEEDEEGEADAATFDDEDEEPIEDDDADWEPEDEDSDDEGESEDTKDTEREVP